MSKNKHSLKSVLKKLRADFSLVASEILYKVKSFDYSIPVRIVAYTAIFTGTFMVAKAFIPKALYLAHTAPRFTILPVKNPSPPDVPPSMPAYEDRDLDSGKTEIISLSEENSVVMDQVFDDKSVQTVMLEMQRLSDKLSKSATIYLVMNTPGGNVMSGIKLITFAKALPQKVKTVTIFAASMGFHTVQQLDERLIVAKGTLMSHPASFGVGGSSPYQLKSRLGYIMSVIDNLDDEAAARMQMSFRDYQDLVHDEYWAFDSDAIAGRAADRRVLASCGHYSRPTKTIKVDTMFGAFLVEVASCPLIPGFISVKSPNGASKAATDYVKLMLTDRTAFTKDFMINNKYTEFQP